MTLQAQRDELVSRHLARYPRDAGYVALLLRNEEFAPDDKSYDHWLRYNLKGIDIGQRLIQRLEREIGPIAGKRVLDIGAGGGGNAIALAEHGCKVTAMEIDPIRINWLRTRITDHHAPVTILNEPVESVQFDRKFDLIICNAVLEHVESWKDFLAHLLDLTDGHIYLCWPNKFSLLEIASDQHYGLFGAVFLTGRLRALQAPYIRLFGIDRNAWVTAVPSLSAVRRLAARRRPQASVQHMIPEGSDKIATPEEIRHPLANRVVRALRGIGISAATLTRIVISQRKNYEVLVHLRGRATD